MSKPEMPPDKVIRHGITPVEWMFLVALWLVLGAGAFLVHVYIVTLVQRAMGWV